MCYHFLNVRSCSRYPRSGSRDKIFPLQTLKVILWKYFWPQFWLWKLYRLMLTLLIGEIHLFFFSFHQLMKWSTRWIGKTRSILGIRKIKNNLGIIKFQGLSIFTTQLNFSNKNYVSNLQEKLKKYTLQLIFATAGIRAS